MDDVARRERVDEDMEYWAQFEGGEQNGEEAPEDDF